MRKRQKPYVLIMFLLVAASAMAFISLSQSSSGQAPHPDAPPATGNDIQVPDKQSIAAKVASDAKKSTTTPGGQAQIHKPKHMIGDEPDISRTDRPIVAKDPPAPYKPEPNASSTANQWWTDQSTKSYDPKASDATKKSPATLPVPAKPGEE